MVSNTKFLPNTSIYSIIRVDLHYKHATWCRTRLRNRINSHDHLCNYTFIRQKYNQEQSKHVLIKHGNPAVDTCKGFSKEELSHRTTILNNAVTNMQSIPGGGGSSGTISASDSSELPSVLSSVYEYSSSAKRFYK